MSIGLKRGTVKLVDYDPQWAEEFEREKKILLGEFGDKILAIEHIGSTAVPGLVAKPIIDMNVAVKSLADINEFIEGLPKLGYEYMPERRFADRQFFPKGPEEKRTHHLNLVELSSETGWKSPLMFRDYLRTHPEAREGYAKLKEKLAQAHADNRAEYTAKKNQFIKEILRNN